VSVAGTATVAGAKVALSGPANLDGTATYTATFTELPAGEHSWSVKAGSLSHTGRVEVF